MKNNRFALVVLTVWLSLVGVLVAGGDFFLVETSDIVGKGSFKVVCKEEGERMEEEVDDENKAISETYNRMKLEWAELHAKNRDKKERKRKFPLKKPKRRCFKPWGSYKTEEEAQARKAKLEGKAKKIADKAKAAKDKKLARMSEKRKAKYDEKQVELDGLIEEFKELLGTVAREMIMAQLTGQSPNGKGGPIRTRQGRRLGENLDRRKPLDLSMQKNNSIRRLEGGMNRTLTMKKPEKKANRTVVGRKEESENEYDESEEKEERKVRRLGGNVGRLRPVNLDMQRPD